MNMETYFRELESAWKPMVPAHAYTILRVDGRNFSSFTRGMNKPFDLEFVQRMDLVAVQLCKEIQNARFAYVQSDEISVFICTEDEKAQAWFGGNLSKLVSVSAGMASSAMTALYGLEAGQPLVCFDSRVFTVPSREDVLRYFMWRQADAFRNAVSMASSARFSHKELNKKTVWDRLEMLQDVGVDFHKTYPAHIWRGRVVTPESRLAKVSYIRKDTGKKITEEAWRTFWKPDCAPAFDWDTTGFLEKNVPLRLEEEK